MAETQISCHNVYKRYNARCRDLAPNDKNFVYMKYSLNTLSKIFKLKRFQWTEKNLEAAVLLSPLAHEEVSSITVGPVALF